MTSDRQFEQKREVIIRISAHLPASPLPSNLQKFWRGILDFYGLEDGLSEFSGSLITLGIKLHCLGSNYPLVNTSGTGSH
jgi:hypothetical protein